MMTIPWILVLASGLPASTGKAGKTNKPTTPSPADPPHSAREAVHEGNLLLRAGDAAGALKDYDKAAALDPQAPEIPFVQGLGYYQLGEYDKAREAFRKAAAAKNQQLAADALYSLGTTYHAQALQNLDKPKVAIQNLERAMQQYRTVLADHPNHEAARDADFKAASLRRTLLKKLQQQQKKQKPSPQKKDQDSPKKKKDQDKQPSPEKQNQKKKENPTEQSKQDQASKSLQDSSQEKQKSSSAEPSPKEKKRDGATDAKKQKERNSREQAQRRLREMMQALRDRQKHRRKPVARIPIKPVEKDW